MMGGYSFGIVGIPAEIAFALKATVVIAGALVAGGVIWRASAACRHLIVAAGFAALAILPAAIMAMPSTVLRVPAGRSVTLPAVMVGGSNISPRDLVQPELLSSLPPEEVASWSSLDWSAADAVDARGPNAATWLWAAWGLGALLFLLPVAMTLRRTRTLVRSGEPWAQGATLAETLWAARTPVRVLRHEGVMVPLVCGVQRPTIVLPFDAVTWNESELRAALLHELEHVRRRDWPIHVLARTVCALYWFHPLVWMAWRRLRYEAERACDDAVVRSVESTTYATTLVRLAERLSPGGAQPFLAMVRKSQLSKRVTALLDARRSRRPASWPWTVTVLVMASVCVFGIASVGGVLAVELPSIGKAEVVGLDAARVRLIPSWAPDFDQRVRAFVRHGADLALACKPDLAILVNESPHTIVAYADLFRGLDGTGTTLHRYPEAVAGDGRGHVFPRNQGVRPGEQRLVNRTFELDPEAEDNSWLESICGAGGSWPGQLPARTIQLDAVIFDDGTLVGPNESRLDEHFAAHVRAQQDGFRLIVERIRAGDTLENARKVLREWQPGIDSMRGGPRHGDAASYQTFYRELAAGEISRWTIFYPNDSQRTYALFENAIRTEPFEIHRAAP